MDLSDVLIRGSDPDYKISIAWVQDALDKGYAKAATKMADYYIRGLGVSNDYDAAIKYCLKAIEMGDDSAQKIIDDISKYKDISPVANKIYSSGLKF